MCGRGRSEISTAQKGMSRIESIASRMGNQQEPLRGMHDDESGRKPAEAPKRGIDQYGRNLVYVRS